MARVAGVGGSEAAELPRPRAADELRVLQHGRGRGVPVAGRPAQDVPQGAVQEAVPGARVIWAMLALLLGLMLIGIPILLCIALVGFVGMAAEPGVVMPLFAQKTFAQLDS